MKSGKDWAPKSLAGLGGKSIAKFGSATPTPTPPLPPAPVLVADGDEDGDALMRELASGSSLDDARQKLANGATTSTSTSGASQDEMEGVEQSSSASAGGGATTGGSGGTTAPAGGARTPVQLPSPASNDNDPTSRIANAPPQPSSSTVADAPAPTTGIAPHLTLNTSAKATISNPLFISGASQSSVSGVPPNDPFDKLDNDGEELDELTDSDDEPLSAASSAPIASTSSGKQPSSSNNYLRKIAKHRSKPVPQAGQSGLDATTSSPSTIPLPHYTIERAPPGSKEPHRIKVKKGVTDASPHKWPANDPVGHLIDGKKNWHVAQAPTDHKHKDWRTKLGMWLAEWLDEGGTSAGGKQENWILDDWPEQYRFYIHHSGKPGAPDRTDPYLYGCTTVAKFRTPKEFLPHLYWLLVNGPGKNMTCVCKYCSNSNQGAVNKKVGLEDERRATSVSLEPAERPQKRARPSEPGPVSKEPKPNKKPRPSEPILKSKPAADPSPKPASAPKPAPVVKPRPRSASPTYSGAFADEDREKDLTEGYRFRSSELVWVKLPAPLVDPTGDRRGDIQFWPAVIIRPVVDPKGVKGPPGPDGKATIKNEERWKYQVKCVSTLSTFTVEEEKVIPWLGYNPEPESTCLSQDVFLSEPAIKMVYNGVKVSRPRIEMMKDAHEAATTFALSIQVSAHIVNGFTLIDRYSVKEDHLPLGRNLTSEEKLIRDHQLKLWHYQSVWWGAERLWTGELIRLMSDERLFPSNLQPLCGDVTEARLYLKVSAFYKRRERDAEKGEGVAMVIGRLYELIEEDRAPESTRAAAKKNKDRYMPPPPAPGYVFHCHETGGDMHLDFEYVAGRYYPLAGKLRRKAEIDRVLKEDAELSRKAQEEDKENKGKVDETGQPVASPDETPLTEEMRALALAGVMPAYRLFMKSESWKEDRKKIVTSAETTANEEMVRYIQSAKPDMFKN
ncbi:hypothetical protein MNV49_000893 [Pseudohyphozyma bogoriensis]|nr:hypothetical protein MNV49_000893 [Pseudohyphozyma bogoriensis]